jgi:hypothetical protein
MYLVVQSTADVFGCTMYRVPNHTGCIWLYNVGSYSVLHNDALSSQRTLYIVSLGPLAVLNKGLVLLLIVCSFFDFSVCGEGACVHAGRRCSLIGTKALG